MDRHLLAVRERRTGAIERKLRSFGHVCGLVFGSWSETSADVAWLMHQLAEWASMHSRQVGAHRDAEVIRVALLTNMQRRWSIMAACANAQLLFDRLDLVGRGAGAASSRRASSWAMHAAAGRSRPW